MYNILVCDDDKDIVEAIDIYLSKEGYNIIKAYDGMEAMEILKKEDIQLLLIDVMMPRLDGIRATLKIREKSIIPIIILSAKSEDSDKIIGLDVGADDYITKPFGTSELLARVRTALRHSQNRADINASGGVFRAGKMRIDYDKRRVTVDGADVHLTQTEYNIVALLSRHAGRVLTYDFVMRETWGPGVTGGSNQILRVNMANIRRKLEKNPAEPEYIFTETGVGYRMLDGEKE